MGWIEAVDVRAGDRVLHIGTGLGYYTAILAELAGPAGSVVGYEVDAALAARAEAALRPWPGFTAAVKPTAAVVEPHERGAACLVHLPGFCLQA